MRREFGAQPADLAELTGHLTSAKLAAEIARLPRPQRAAVSGRGRVRVLNAARHLFQEKGMSPQSAGTRQWSGSS
jgi:hypothetical protein